MSKQTVAPSKEEVLSVGELARQAGVTPRTVRYYEEMGLVTAEPRAPNGRRTYTRQHLTRLRLIRRAKLLGLSLAEIKELADVFREYGTETSLIKHSVEILTSHLDKVEQKQRELESYHALLVNEIARLKQLLQGQMTRNADLTSQR